MSSTNPPRPLPGRPSVLFGIQQKLFLLVGFFAFILFGTVLYGFYGLRRIAEISTVITKEKIPLVISVREALVAMLTAKLALENALAVSDYARLSEIQDQEAVLNSAVIHFDVFLAAITWGSESEAFLRSAGGLNAAQWQRLKEHGRLTVPRASPEEAQRAAIAKIYFRGLAQNALKAIASHKRLLRMTAEGATAQSGGADDQREDVPPTLDEMKEHTAAFNARVLRFSSLVTESLGETTQLTNQSMSESALSIERIQREVRRNGIIIFTSGFVLVLAAGLLFVHASIIRPLKALTRIAQRIGSGDLGARPRVTNRDEIGILGQVFNDMADRLTDYAENLEVRVKERTRELDEAARLFVRKDQELTLANETLMRLNQELDQVAKILVRRDLELSRANLRLEELDRLKSEFVTVAAHQLRTPLAGIRWSLAALKETETGNLNPEQTKLVEGTLKVTLAMIDLINDLLNVARIEEGRFGFALTAQPLVPVIEELLPLVRKVAQDKGIVFRAELPQKPLIVVSLDKEKFKMALDNLLENAIKYTPPGGTVTLGVMKEPEALRMTIADTGIGIPANQQERLFTKFFRADNALLFQTAGTGLGLYVVKNIIEHHGGTIHLESEEGKGTTVTVTLPIPA